MVSFDSSAAIGPGLEARTDKSRPRYAKNCNHSRYKSACSCIGIRPHTKTVPGTTRTVTETKTVTKTKKTTTTTQSTTVKVNYIAFNHNVLDFNDNFDFNDYDYDFDDDKNYNNGPTHPNKLRTLRQWWK
ncbi:unnamed protein product [Cercospora beticola]|nr:unnamed protein product [Cercospora beticola]